MTTRKLQDFLPNNQEENKIDTTPSFEKEPTPIKIDYECPLCGDMGFLRHTTNVQDERFGRSYPCSCTLEKRKTRLTETLLANSGLGALKRLNFDNLLSVGRTSDKANQTNYEKATQIAKDYSAVMHGWLVILGEHGSGKTHVAASIVNAAIARGIPTMFFSVADLVDYFHSALNKEKNGEATDRGYSALLDIPLLVIDDCYSQISNEWGQQKFEQLINHRWNAKLPTVFTTLALNDDLDPRLSIRLSDDENTQIVDLGIWESAPYSFIGAMDKSTVTKFKFENFVSDGIGLSKTQRQDLVWLEGRLREWAAQPDGWIVLTGSHGVGKTHLACAIANVRMEQGDRVAFATVPDLLDHLRASYKQEQSESYDQTFKRLLDVKLLVLDDLGAHRSSDWAEEKIYQLINHRYTTRAWTIITMNGKPSNLEDRIASRLTFTELSEVYEVEAPDFRTLRPTS